MKKALIIYLMPIVCLCILYWLQSYWALKDSEKRYCLELRSLWRIWDKAGRPENEKFTDFMIGMPNWVVSTQIFEIQGVKDRALLEELRGGTDIGRLFITTNGILICIRPDGSSEIITRFGPVQ